MTLLIVLIMCSVACIAKHLLYQSIIYQRNA